MSTSVERATAYAIGAPCIDALDRGGVVECLADCTQESGRSVHVDADQYEVAFNDPDSPSTGRIGQFSGTSPSG